MSEPPETATPSGGRPSPPDRESPAASQAPAVVGPPGRTAPTPGPPIPLFDLVLETQDFEAVTESLASGWLTMGPRIEAFEQAFARHLGVKHAIALSSCTAALHLAYLAAGVGPGDEVIVPSFTFVATANAAVYCGARPVFADIVDCARPVIGPEQVEPLISERTRAVVAVHYGGYAAPVDGLADLCRARGIALVEDAAHAPASELHGRSLGTFGLAGTFSFFSNKVLSVGEGGLLATDDDAVAARVRSLRSHAMTSGTWSRHQGHASSYDVVDIGFNYRMDEPRAALAHSRLARLQADVSRRRELTLAYRRRLRDLPEVLCPFDEREVADSSCYVMPVFLREPAQRDRVRQGLQERHGVQTSILYPATHEFSVYRAREPHTVLPATELAASSQLTLPLYPHMTGEQQDRVLFGLADTLGGGD